MTQVNKWKGNRREIGEDFFATPNSAILPIKPYISNAGKVRKNQRVNISRGFGNYKKKSLNIQCNLKIKYNSLLE